MNREEWKEIVPQEGNASSMQEDLQPGSSNYISNHKHNRRSFFKSPMLRSFLIAILLLGIAATIHFLTTSTNTERKRGIYNAKDGSVYQVEAYLKKELANPESFQAIHWSAVEKTGDLIGSEMYRVSVIYKASDNGGKPFMASKMLELDEEGNVWMVMEVDPFRSSPAQNSKQ